MFRYYISGESWERISEKTFMSIRRVYLLRKSALKKLENLYLKGIDE